MSGGVAGGVAGGVRGDVASGRAAPAAPGPAAQGYVEGGSVAETISVVGEAGQVDVKSSASAATISRDQIARLPEPREYDGERRRSARENEAARDAAPDTMIFRETPANRFVDSAEDRLSTFALDVDTGSYTLTRGYLDRGLLPPPAAIRVEEFVNAQEYDDPAPVRGAATSRSSPREPRRPSIPASAPACCASRSKRARSTSATGSPPSSPSSSTSRVR